jgi:hypothetical protein
MLLSSCPGLENRLQTTAVKRVIFDLGPFASKLLNPFGEVHQIIGLLLQWVMFSMKYETGKLRIWNYFSLLSGKIRIEFGQL